jgi:hypothetical protein
MATKSRLPECWSDIVPDLLSRDTRKVEVYTILQVAATAALGSLQIPFNLETAEKVNGYLLNHSSQEDIDKFAIEVTRYILINPDKGLEFVEACIEMDELIKRLNKKNPPFLQGLQVVRVPIVSQQDIEEEEFPSFPIA